MNASNGHASHAETHLIELNQVVKAYQTPVGDFIALKNIDLQVDAGEFVAVIGKSGSGKSTLINMITGIDRPTSGEVFVAGKSLAGQGEGQLAEWRGHTIGVVFQFFQLLPTLTVAENVMLPMDFCDTYSARVQRERALHLLAEVDIDRHAGKLPSEISGGEQQRVAIARASANDPPIVVADEPTGNLDSKTAESIFMLFDRLVAQGKTFLIVTHDRDLARLATRTVILSDGEIVDEYLAQAFPYLAEEQLMQATHQLDSRHYEPGQVILQAGTQPDRFYLITQGQVEVNIPGPGEEIVAARLESGQFFGEIELLRGGRNLATVRAAPNTGVEVVTLDRASFEGLIATPSAREEVDRIAEERLAENLSLSDHKPVSP